MQTLLLADDSVTIQRVIELTFADEAINVVAVSDGDQAIEHIEANPPDIVLVDIGMPGRTGYEVSGHIKQSERLKHIPVLLLTGAFEPVDQAKAAEAGCDGVLAKPFEPQLVISRVKELLERGGAAPAVAVAEEPVEEQSEPVEVQPLPGDDIWGSAPATPEAEPPRPARVTRLDDYFEQLDAAFATLSGSTPTPQAKGVPPPPLPVADIIDWFGATAAQSAPRSDLPLSMSTPAPTPTPQSAPEAEEAWSMSEPEQAAAPQSEPEPQPEPEPERSWSMPEPEQDAPLPEPELALHTPTPEQAPALVEPSEDVIPESWDHSEFEDEAEIPATEEYEAPSQPAALPPMADAFAAILAAEQHEPMPSVAPPWPQPPGSSNGRLLSEEAIEEITARVLNRLSNQVVRDTVADVVSTIAERLIREEIERIKASIK